MVKKASPNSANISDKNDVKAPKESAPTDKNPQILKNSKTSKNPPTWPLVKRLIDEYLRPHFGTLFLAVCFMIISAAMTAAFAVIIQPIIDHVLVAGNTAKVWGLGAAIFLIFFIRGISGYADTILMNKIGQYIVATIQTRMFAHFMHLDLRFFHKNPSGQLISRVINDVNVLRTSVTSCLTGITKNLITLVLLVSVMFYQDWLLAAASFTVFPFLAMFVAWVGRRLRKTSGAIQSGHANLSDRLSQIFQGVRLVKAYGMEDHEVDLTGKSVNHVRDLVLKSVRIGNLSAPVNDTIVGLVVCGIIVYGGYQVADGNTTAGQLLSFITAFTMAYEPMKKLARLNNTLQLGLGAADRVFEMLDVKASVIDTTQAQDVSLTQPKIILDGVDFQYEKDERKALNNVSAVLPAGKLTALVGSSGSGKTTIMNLIPRFFDVTAGTVSIDGVNLRDIKKASLRQHIALVSQEITIFDDTVWANIGYGKVGAFQDEIIKAAMAAEADEFIRALPHGYDTRLGEDGVTLSGGQRQRISIARAILRDAPILLLDEATSALDNESERAIQETLAELQKGRTTLVIAHRLSTVQSADQILVLDNGEIVERGDHEGLIALKGVYARMYSAGLHD